MYIYIYIDIERERYREREREDRRKRTEEHPALVLPPEERPAREELEVDAA